MRRIIFATALALAPGLAIAQNADSSANPPPPPPPGADAMGPGPMGPMGPMGDHGGKGRHGPEQFLTDFYAANTTHDGHLTLEQAKTAKFKPIVDHFDEIDVAKHGFITFYDIQAWRLEDMAKHLEAQAAALRAKDK